MTGLREVRYPIGVGTCQFSRRKEQRKRTMAGGVIEMFRIAAHATPPKKSCYYIHEQNELTGTDDITDTDSI